MTVKLIFAQEREFTNDKDELVRGYTLVFFDPLTGNTYRHFVGNDNLKGFDPKQVAGIKGPNLDISTNAKTYLGKTRIVLEKVQEVA